MASNGEIESGDSEIADNNGDKVVTMMDVLQEQEDFEEDANAVLGASDDKNCTYALGYIKRQAIYACMTCCAEAKEDPTKRAGVCLACSLTCHENHELIELYTKRNFRCDCGNPKFSSHPCQFTPNKTDLNLENSYNQNFSGVYCVCHRPYPDPEATEEDEMIQCIVCEDWLHASHLEATVPTMQYAEMICKGCMQKNKFLHNYSDLAVNTEIDYVDVVNTSKDMNELLNGDTKSKITTDAANGTVPSNDDGKILDTTNPTENKSEINENSAKELDSKLEKTEENKDATLEKDKETESSEQNDKNISELKTTLEVIENQEKMDEKCIASKEIIGSSDDSLTKNNETQKSEELERSTSQLEDSKLEENKTSENNLNTSEDSSTKKDSNGNTDISTEANTDKNNDSIKDIKEDNKEAKDINKSDANAENNSLENCTEEKMEEDKVLEDIDGNNKKDISDNDLPNEINTKESTETSLPVDKSVESLGKEDQTKEKDHLQSTESNKMDSSRNESDVQNDEEAASVSLNESKESAEEISVELKTTSTSNDKNKNNNTNMESNKEASSDTISSDVNEKGDIKRKLSVDESPDLESKKRKVDSSQCNKPKESNKYKGATFWPSDFRQKLCTCSECLSMYKDLSVLFLIDPEDTVTAYENLGKEKTNGKPVSQYEKGLQALSSLDRIQQINVLTEYNKMRDKFLDFLKSFKDRRKVVTEEDVKAFFAGMKPTKRPDGVYFCR